MGRIAAAALSLGLVALGACGGGTEPSRAPDAPPASPAQYPAPSPSQYSEPTPAMDQPTTVDGAAASLDQAEMELNRAIPTGAEPFASPPGQPGATRLSEGEACATACRALASMQRAAAHLCELAGDGERCDAARARVQTANDRVHHACPGCVG